jgi:hypothetical protein
MLAFLSIPEENGDVCLHVSGGMSVFLDISCFCLFCAPGDTSRPFSVQGFVPSLYNAQSFIG